MTSGVLVVDKEAGPTSFDVVTMVRRRLKVRRVGHAGTLDPGALGVLPILIGEATKLTPYLTDQDKEYWAVLRFGLTTDTLDVSGQVLAQSAVPPLTVDDVVRASRPLVGRIRQVPPMYSAAHYQGRRLYELAREGREVVRQPREVVVYSIAVEEVVPPRATLRVICGKGTYVRVLAADIGAALGCGAVVERLIRNRVGPYARAAGVPSGAISEQASEDLWARVQPPESALTGWRSIALDQRATTAFLHGQPVEARGDDEGLDRLVAVHAAAGGFLGVGERVAGGRWVRPARIVHADRPGPRVLPA